MNCPRGKVRNPKTNRCVSRTGKIGKLLQHSKGKRKDTGKILNPKTGRYVSRTGKIGREILAGKVARPLSRRQSRSLSRLVSPKVASRVSRKKVIEYATDNPQYISIWRDYFLKRYKDVCSYKTSSDQGINLLVDTEDKELSITKGWQAFFKKCRKRFVFEFLVIVFEDGGGHANGILIDKKQKRVYHFEPNGTIANKSKVIQRLPSIMKKAVKEFNIFKGYKYIEPVKVCPYFHGIQQKEDRVREEMIRGEADGYCLIWVMIFIHYCITNPKKRPSQVVKHLLSKPKELTEKVRKYATFLIRLKRKR